MSEISKIYTAVMAWGPVGILTKVHVISSLQNGSIYPILKLNEFRPDMHQAFMVHGHYTRYE